MEYLYENSEGFRVKDVDIFVLSTHNEATDSVCFFMALLECSDAGDDGLTLEGNVLKHVDIRSQVLTI